MDNFNILWNGFIAGVIPVMTITAALFAGMCGCSALLFTYNCLAEHATSEESYATQEMPI